MHHGRIRTTLIALAGASALLLLPATALAGSDDPDKAPLRAEKRHFLKMYKVEKQVSLFGEGYYHDDRTHVYCRPGDFAIDGMWRIDNVDQDQSGVKNLTDVDVYKSYADGFDHSKWHFEIYNNNQGQAQLKLFATCLGKKTAENSHLHEWELDHAGHWYDEPHDFTSTGWTGTGQLTSHPSGPGPDGQCNPGAIAISPGFSWTKGYGELVRSHPASTNLRSWNWEFDVKLLDGSGDAQVYLSHKCIKRASTTAHGHYHKLRMKWRTDYSPPGPPFLVGFLAFIPGETVQTKQVGCWQHSKAMLHSFNIFDFTLAVPEHRVWFLGMDPRPKKRAYKLWNKHSSQQPVRLGAVCWHDRTGKKRRP